MPRGTDPEASLEATGSTCGRLRGGFIDRPSCMPQQAAALQASDNQQIVLFYCWISCPTVIFLHGGLSTPQNLLNLREAGTVMAFVKNR